MQIPVPKASEPEVRSLPGTVSCRLDSVDERSTVRFNGSVSVQRMKHVVDGPNVLFAIMVNAEAAAPFVLNRKQDYPLADFIFRVRFVTRIARTQKLEDLLD